MKHSLEELRKLQEEMSKRVVLREIDLGKVEHVLGVDQAFLGDKIISVGVLMSFPEMKIMGSSVRVEREDFPYIPGYLMFREGPSALKVVKELLQENTLILVDGSGIAHPRRCGLATYIGIETQTPTIGITKSRLFGEYTEPRDTGDISPLTHNGEIIGYAMKTCRRCKPIFISPGNMITPLQAVEAVKLCLKGYKLPEPIRIADRLSKERRKEEAENGRYNKI
ncbi:Endonuclease V [Archaeoglobus sulfaticallidus PM70-1]|uniref:Endonuclease V n=1 Tax=Archaeoglobus sulfaticallidus PM70-1 TaxID=387631 RepID=N0BBY7_9EURY|nr:endonuclease V [Archaeoglobus sulfaticallidus]AGK61134.1 Endonuclease V [Archaeoglobus sulfaticallidus PM70-1]